MNCPPLPNTGLGVNLVLLLAIAIGCLVLGTVMVLARRRRAATAALMILSVAGIILVIPSGTPAQASSSDCGTPAGAGNSLTVRQTSTMDGLAPGSAPVAITGLVVNNSLDSTHITAVKVEITSVTARPGPGICDAGDYFLLASMMPVQRTLGPGGSAPFTGASIGLSNKPTNQDACQHATIHLLYTANPGQ